MIWSAGVAAVAAVASFVAATPEYTLPTVWLTGTTARVGHVDLVATKTPGASAVRIVEDVDGVPADVVLTPTSTGATADVEWDCERTTRTFRAIADGQSSPPFIVLTPTCEQRLQVVVPAEVPRRGNVRVKFRDLWRIGDLNAVLCVRPPVSAPGCGLVGIPDGQFLANRVFPAVETGTWEVRADTLYQHPVHRLQVTEPRRAERPDVPSILTTGDSLMTETTTALQRSVGRRAEVLGDVYPSAGLLKPFVVDWRTLPGKQVRAFGQDATVLSLGIGDGAPIGRVACCGGDWVDAYAALARRVMRTYSRDGRAAVVWLNVPYPRDADPAPLSRVNLALERAARGLPRVRVLDIARLLTPGRSYRETLVRDGRRVKVRLNDGVHFAPAGARIVADAVRRALARLGVPT